MGQLTYTTQEVQDRLDAVGTFVRPNLLDNAYFVGGGSQQGGGQFPINQRGQTSYSNTTYGIDRWSLSTNPNYTFTVKPDCVEFKKTAASNNPVVTQPVPPGSFAGLDLTLSIMYKCVGRFRLRALAVGGNELVAIIPESSSISVFSMSVNHANGFTSFGYQTISGAVGDYIDVYAIKLEIGKGQTLAHWDETAQEWVLNEVPNFQQELAKCQRYCYVADWDATRFTRMYGTTTGTAVAQLTFPTPVTMRTLPSVSSAVKITIYCQGAQYSTTTYTVMAISEGSVTIRVTALDSGSFPGSFIPCIGLFDSGTLIVLSADL